MRAALGRAAARAAKAVIPTATVPTPAAPAMEKKSLRFILSSLLLRDCAADSKTGPPDMPSSTDEGEQAPKKLQASNSSQVIA
jgi:hypothetical protein